MILTLGNGFKFMCCMLLGLMIWSFLASFVSTAPWVPTVFFPGVFFLERSADPSPSLRLMAVLLLGYVQDVMAGAPTGLHAFLFVIAFVLMRFFIPRFFERKKRLQFLWLVVLTLQMDLALFSLYLIYKKNYGALGFYPAEMLTLLLAHVSSTVLWAWVGMRSFVGWFKLD